MYLPVSRKPPVIGVVIAVLIWVSTKQLKYLIWPQRKRKKIVHTSVGTVCHAYKVNLYDKEKMNLLLADPLSEQHLEYEVH